MMPLHLAILWHQHQPYYPDDVSGETLMPWVRLHGTKDYYGMALHLKEVPEFRCTINLVPSLLLQIEQLVAGRKDRHLEVSSIPADSLSHADVAYLLDNFFMANAESMIRPYPRYQELYLKRGFGVDSVENAIRRFSAKDLRDLQVWSNLTWIHELAFVADTELAEFRRKGAHWTEEEKQWLLDKQREILSKIIPLHRELAESGQIELTTTPFYHPILPLLWNKRSAHQAMPGCPLPQALDSYAEDAKAQLRRAVEYHETLFGETPVGLWPSEGSVSHDIVPAIAEAGLRWIATDEEILSESTGGAVGRDGQGHIRNPELLFRPWSVEKDGHELQMVFRDHALSDLIGFHYQRSDPHHAANDLLMRLEATARAVEGKTGGRPAIVPIILDGENCWEYYPDGGVGFLRTFYQSVARHSQIHSVRIRDHLAQYPAQDRITHLYAGSWISHNFAIWIGHHEDNTAWDRLHETREFLKAKSSAGGVAAEPLRRAWEELYIAEGSDWFWWYGDDHSSAQDALFDQLFRRHLQNVYTLLEEVPPANLHQPIHQGLKRQRHTTPTGFLPVKVDGRRTYFEWISAGKYSSRNERGTMAIVTAGLLNEVYFGFDRDRLLLRIDTAGHAADDLAVVEQLRVLFQEPPGCEVRVTGLNVGQPRAKLYQGEKPNTRAKVEVAVGPILELAVRLADLNLKPDDPVEFAIEALAKKHSLDRAPREGSIELRCPTEDFELVMWQA
jgi:alpha-amylase/alpha-mannosidase (GH57 family)